MKKSIPLFIALLFPPFVKSQTTAIVYFDSNESQLNPGSMKTLDSISTFVSGKTWKMDIKGHCDNTGIYRFNQILSDFRAESVFKYLIEKNKSGDGNFSFKGFSSDQSIADNSTENGKAKNRRVEIIVTITETPKVIVEKKPDLIAGEQPVPSKSGTLDEKSSEKDLEVGKILLLKNMNFVGGTSELLKESEPSLLLLLKLMKEHPTLEIEIEGHVCCANDFALSVDRALVVKEYLENNGIKEKRLRYQGHGWNNPIASDQTETGRIQNRRVEILILKL